MEHNPSLPNGVTASAQVINCRDLATGYGPFLLAPIHRLHATPQSTKSCTSGMFVAGIPSLTLPPGGDPRLVAHLGLIDDNIEHSSIVPLQNLLGFAQSALLLERSALTQFQMVVVALV